MSSARRLASRRLRQFIGLAACVGVLVFGSGVASAERPSDIVEDLADDGVYVAEGRDYDAAALAKSVAAADKRGLSLFVVVPDDPQPETKAFARRVQEATDVDAVLTFGPDDSIEGYANDALRNTNALAVQEAQDASTPTASADAYAQKLTSDPERGLPIFVSILSRLLFFLILAMTVAVVLEQKIRRDKVKVAAEANKA